MSLVETPVEDCEGLQFAHLEVHDEDDSDREISKFFVSDHDLYLPRRSRLSTRHGLLHLHALKEEAEAHQ